MRTSLACLAIAASAGLASAQSYVNTTVGGPTWDRPVGAGPSISGLGPVNYHEQPFFVDTTGLYTIDSLQFDPPAWDGYIHIYENSFNPIDQLTGLIAGDDDGPGGIGTSQVLDLNLNSGTQYFIITSGFAAGDAGMFENTVSGAGTATFGLVPAPASLALIGLGGLVGGRRRR